MRSLAAVPSEGISSCYCLREAKKESQAEGVPARSPAASVGAAGWSWLGRGARILLYIVGLGRYLSLVFALVVVAGGMPFWSSSPTLTRSARCSSASSSTPAPWWRRKGGERSGNRSLNKRVAAPTRAAPASSFPSPSRLGDGRGISGSVRRRSGLGWLFSLDPSFQRGCLALICRGASSKLPSVASIVVMDDRRRSQGMLDEADGVREHTRWWFWRSCGALLGCCPASDELPYLQVEGRPISFLPATMPKGRQACFTVESMEWRHGGPVGPSGAVPGAGGTRSIRRQFRTRLQSTFLVRGLFCIMQGLVCNFLFLRGLAAKCTLMLING